MKKYAGLLALLVLAVLAAWLESGNRNAGTPSAQREAPRTQAPQAPAAPRERTAAQGSGFDFYVLSLSWSATWCQSAKGDSSDSQCDTRRRSGYVVHGLWPQNERGYPEFCASREPQRVPDQIGRPLLDIMPSMGLIGHQWRKHGSCSGLSQKDYFNLVREARNAVTIPAALDTPDRARTSPVADLETAFIRANPGMKADGIAATCSGRKLEEVRICLTRDLKFRSCAEVDRQGCRAATLEIPSLR